MDNWKQRLEHKLIQLKLRIAHWWEHVTGKQLLTYLATLIITVLVIIFLVVPGITGYRAFRQIRGMNESVSGYGAKLAEARDSLERTESLLDACETDKERAASERDQSRTALESCQAEAKRSEAYADSEVAKMRSELEETSKQLASVREGAEAALGKMDELQEAADDATKRYDTLASNAANNICCKARVDDKTIDSYDVADDRIRCTSGGSRTISC